MFILSETGSYLEPVECTFHPIYSRYFLIFSSHLCPGLDTCPLSGLFPSDFRAEDLIASHASYIDTSQLSVQKQSH
jgi:hypothetical protein